MKEDIENPPKKIEKMEKEQKEEQWNFEAALNGFVLLEVSKANYSFRSKADAEQDQLRCAS